MGRRRFGSQKSFEIRTVSSLVEFYVRAAWPSRALPVVAEAPLSRVLSAAAPGRGRNHGVNDDDNVRAQTRWQPRRGCRPRSSQFRRGPLSRLFFCSGRAFAASFRLNFSPRSESRGSSWTCGWAQHAHGASMVVAIVRRAQMRAAPDHLARDFDVGKIGIGARVVPAAARILQDAFCTLVSGFGPAPLPHIACRSPWVPPGIQIMPVATRSVSLSVRSNIVYSCSDAIEPPAVVR
jgi:hypothetical protein